MCRLLLGCGPPPASAPPALPDRGLQGSTLLPKGEQMGPRCSVVEEVWGHFSVRHATQLEFTRIGSTVEAHQRVPNPISRETQKL